MLESISAKKTFQTTQIIYYGLLAGQFMLAAVMVFLTFQSNVTKLSVDLSNPLILCSIVLTIGIVLLVMFIHNKQREKSTQIDNLKQALPHFQSAIVMRSAAVEGVNLMNLIFFYLERNPFYLLAFSFGIFVFVALRPTLNLLKKDYNLKEREVDLLK